MDAYERVKRHIIANWGYFETGRFDGDVFWYSEMAFSRIVELQRKFFSGHVEMLQLFEPDGYYFFQDMKNAVQFGEKIFKKYPEQAFRRKFCSLLSQLNSSARILFRNRSLNPGAYADFAEKLQLFSSFSVGAIEVLEKYVEWRILQLGKSSRDTSLLLTPTYTSYVSLCENDLARIIKRLPASEKRLLRAKCRDINHYSALKKLLRVHIRRYGWTHTNYLSHELPDDKFFLDEAIYLSGSMKKHILKEKSIDAKKKKKAELMRSLRPDERILIRYIDMLYELRDKRKELMIKITIPLKNILKRYENRFSYETLRWLTWKEQLELIFRNKKRLLKLSKERARSSLFVRGMGVDYAILSGEQSISIKKLLLEKNSLKELHGYAANPGFARGKAVVVVSKSDFSSFRLGCILVTSHTTPDFISVMKKSKAILAERGGITSHAAIVSRELGIPCIVGVRNLTHSIRSGDLVEVDATKGIVRVFKRQKG